MDERKPWPDWPDTEFREEGRDFAPDLRDAEVFDEDPAGIAPRERQAQETPSQIVIFDTANVATVVRECFGNGPVHGEALFAGVQRSGGERAVKTARSNVKMTGIRPDQRDAAAKIRG